NPDDLQHAAELQVSPVRVAGAEALDIRALVDVEHAPLPVRARHRDGEACGVDRGEAAVPVVVSAGGLDLAGHAAAVGGNAAADPPEEPVPPVVDPLDGAGLCAFGLWTRVCALMGPAQRASETAIAPHQRAMPSIRGAMSIRAGALAYRAISLCSLKDTFII